MHSALPAWRNSTCRKPPPNPFTQPLRPKPWGDITCLQSYLPDCRCTWAERQYWGVRETSFLPLSSWPKCSQDGEAFVPQSTLGMQGQNYAR